jgi:hypothetical protein
MLYMNIHKHIYGPGTRNLFVGVELTVEETEGLIECAEKEGKESVERMESASTTGGPAQGKE